jgi:hypothetical protein
MTLKQLNTPSKIQDYLDSIPFNFEKGGETCMPPHVVLEEKKAHCIEGAMLAAAALSLTGEKPLLHSLKVKKGDFDHVVALYKKDGYWGAISKTNHSVLRFRDPVYKTVRELAVSYFHEYFLVTDGSKTMLGYAGPIDINTLSKDWKSSREDQWDLAEKIFTMEHISVIPSAVVKKNLRVASRLERQAAGIPEWSRDGSHI